MDESKNEKKTSRRDFIRKGLIAGAGVVAGGSLIAAYNDGQEKEAGEKVKALTTDGEIIEVDRSMIKAPRVSVEEAHKGIPGRKFVMVIDLSKCKNARKCVTECQKGHHLPKSQEFMKVYLLQDSDKNILS